MIVEKMNVVFCLVFFMASCNNKESHGNSVDNVNSVQYHESKHDDNLDIPPQFGTLADAVPKNNRLYTLVDNFIGEYELTKDHILLYVVKLDSGEYEVMTQRIPSKDGGVFLLLKITNSNIQVIEKIFYDK